MESLTISVATQVDCGELSTFVNSAYRGDSSRLGWTTEADLLGGQRVDERGLTELISTADSVVLLMRDGARLIGCVNLQKRGLNAYLGMLTVKPDAQNAGYGKKMLSSAESWAAEHWKVTKIEMTVIRQRSELIAWYERRGYRNTGRMEPFPYGDERFGLPKVGDLAFVVLEKGL